MAGIEWNAISARSNGGTELAARELEQRLAEQKVYADAFHGWDGRAAQWEAFLRGLLDQRSLPSTGEHPWQPALSR